VLQRNLRAIREELVSSRLSEENGQRVSGPRFE
jgi:hypothetical protein